jgi:hypothetical protein
LQLGSVARNPKEGNCRHLHNADFSLHNPAVGPPRLPCQELRVFIRHLEYKNPQLEDGVRLFLAERDTPSAAGMQRRIEGFVLLDPLWRGGEAFGYTTSLNRMRRDGHHGERRPPGHDGAASEGSRGLF